MLPLRRYSVSLNSSQVLARYLIGNAGYERLDVELSRTTFLTGSICALETSMCYKKTHGEIYQGGIQCRC